MGSFASRGSNITYTKSVRKIWDLTSQYNTQTGVSWGINYEGIYNKERLWIKQGLKYDFYDISSKTVGAAPTVSNPYQARPTGCKNTVTSLIAGNKFLSYHGNDQYCTCTWSPANPCPHKLRIEGDASVNGDYQFYPSTALAVDQVTPDIKATYGMAQPQNGCTTITNPSEVNGKWCVVYRGACFFQTKWEMCHAAGAVGTILVVLDDSTGAGWYMWLEAISTPMVGITNSLGEQLRKLWEGGNRDITFTVGKGTGVASPDPQYSSPEPLKTMNYYTGEFTEDGASHFTTVQSLIVNQKSDWGHFIGVNGVGADIQVYDMDQSPPLYKGNYTVGIDGDYGFIYNEPSSGKSPVIMYAMDAWDGEVSFFNMQDELNPSLMGKITYEGCDTGGTDFLGRVTLHPSNEYIYLVPLIHNGACPFKIRLYDISQLPTIQKVAEVHIPEVDDGADIYSFNFGVGNIAALSLSSSGVSWYDFTNPANPTPVAHVDLSAVEDTYTLGVRGTRQSPSDPNVWIIQDETEFFNNFHAVRLVDATLAPTDAPTMGPTDAPTMGPTEAGAGTKSSDACEDDEKTTWQAIAIIFIVLTILCCLAAAFFFQKWNLEVSFKFQQMEEKNIGGDETL